MSSPPAAGAPWRGKSALDAVMLMAQGWEFKREHLELPQRSHYVIPDGGDQPGGRGQPEPWRREPPWPHRAIRRRGGRQAAHAVLDLLQHLHPGEAGRA